MNRGISLLVALLAPLVCQRSFGQGNNNPTGPSGDFNGQSHIGCAVDPFTGNARRVVHDISNIPGVVGAYALNWTRFANSRHTLSSSSVILGQGAYWSHSYSWTIDLSMNIGYPDGRLVPFGDQTEQQAGDILRGPPGTSDRLLVVSAPVGNDLGEYDLLLSDGGKVCFRREAFYAESGAGPYYTTRATKIIDPYGLETDLSFTVYGALDRVTEPAGRYLQINYVTVPGLSFKCIGSVEVNDGRGNVTQSVIYTYVWASNFAQLRHVDYSDGTSANYTYQTDRLLATCDDVRHAGPMKKILYEYMPNGTFGQTKNERNLTTGQVVTQIAYPSDNVRIETKGDNYSRTWTYNTLAQLVSCTDFKGRPSYISYDANGYRSGFQNARGYTTSTLREGNIGALITLTHPDTTFQGYGYTDYGNPYYVNIRGDERGHNSYFSRDEHNRVYKIWYPDYDPQNPNASPAESVIYNDFGQVLTHTMTSGGVETSTYDTRGLKQTYYPPPTESDPNPSTHPIRYFYYTSGSQTDRLRYVVDPKGNATWFEYNPRGQVTKVTHQDGSYVQADYNPDGTLAWMADENHPDAVNDPNQRTRYIYDEYKRVLSVTNPMNETWNVSYAIDPAWANPLIHTTNSIKYLTSPLNKNIVFDYDENFRRIDQVAALGTSDEAWTLFEYDEVGNLTKVTDPRSNATTFEYDTRNRRKNMTDPAPFNNQITQWEYDEVGNLKKEIRPDQLFRRWEYDSTNRVIDTYGFAGEHVHYQRDNAGNVRQMTDPKPATYFFGYDVLNRRTSATYPLDATGVNRTETWRYDIAGNLALYKNPAGQYRHFDFADSYDSRNRLRRAGWNLSNTTASADVSVGQEITVGFDDASRLTSVTTNNGETSVAFGYDDANRKIWEDQTVAGHPAHRVQTTPDQDGNRAALSVLTNGQTNYSISYDYTGRNQLKTIYYGNSTPWFTYTYDGAGQLTGVNYNADGVNVGASINATRIVSYTMTPDTLNRASMNDNGDVTDYTPNALNQNETVAGSDVYYDDKFNLMWTGGFSAGYDAASRLTAVGSGEDYGLFVYDGLGRCLKRNVNWETTIITYDGWNPIVEWDEWDNLSAWNIYGGGADEILWRYSDRSGHLRYHTDRQGNVTALLNYEGTGLERYSYDAFGHPTITDWNGVTQRDFSWYWNHFMFRGREYFADLGLYDMRARFYHPVLGRFLQSDPIGFAGGDANLFRYCGGDPVNGSDPSGLQDAVSERITVIGKHVPGPGTRGGGPVSGVAFTDLNEMLNGGGDQSAGPDERFDPEVRQILVNPLPMILRPDDDEDDVSTGETGGTGESTGSGGTSNDQQAGPLGPVVAASSAFVNWVRSASSAGIMTINFAGGGGPTIRYFGPNSVESANLRGDPETAKKAALAFVNDEVQGVKFGAPGFIDAGLNPTRQFVGGFAVKVSNGHAFGLNITSLRSLLFDLKFVPNHERGSYGPFGNIYQVYDLGPYP